MAIPLAESAELRPGARHWTVHSHSRLFGWLGYSIAQWRKWRDICATRISLDEMSEGQLEEIGMRRFTRRAVWLDCLGSRLSTDFEYRSVLGDGRREDV